MPNWCENHLEICGPEADIAAFKAAAKGEEEFVLLLQNLYPTPQELLDTVAGYMGEGTPEQAELEARQTANRVKYGCGNWYDWRVRNWGTKWDINVEQWSQEEPDRLVADFDSAWSAPCEAFRIIGEQFPNLSFTLSYAESGCDFAGCLAIEGAEVEHFQGGYSDRDKDLFPDYEDDEEDYEDEEPEDDHPEEAEVNESETI